MMLTFNLQKLIRTSVGASEYSLADSSIFGFWGARFPKMGDCLPWTPMNRRAKYGADISTPGLSACVDNYQYSCYARYR